MKAAHHVLFVLVLVASLSAPKLLLCQNLTSAELSCHRFVQDFYDWYVPIGIADKERLMAELLPRKSSFDQRLWQMLAADDEAQSHSDEIVGLDFDPILNSQDPSPKFIVKSVSVKDGRCNAFVVGINEGVEEEHVIPELALFNGHWIFMNFRYESWVSGKLRRSDLVQALKDLANDRARSRKDK
ncbi:MAG: hypothetical protein WBP85_17450, partial [Terracidiphilus sp.]